MQARHSDQVFFREALHLYDPFHLVFVCKALQDAPWMKCAVFGSESHSCLSLPDGPEHKDPISRIFSNYGESQHIISDGKLFIPPADNSLLLEKSTFLDPERSFVEEPGNFDSWIHVRYYPSLS